MRKGKSYLYAHSAFAPMVRDLEVKAGHKASRGKKGAGHGYNLRSHCEQERRWAAQAEAAYARFVAG